MTNKTVSKSAKANVSLAVISPEAGVDKLATANVEDMPSTVEIVGLASQVFVQAAALIRVGYTFDLDCPPSVFQMTGSAAITLIKGNPDSAMVNAANEALETALARELHEKSDTEQRAAAAAVKQLEEETKAAAKAAIEAQIEQQQATLRQLQVDLAKV